MKTQKIVLALALAVTPAVLVAQENGNAYNNQNNKEVIVAQAPKQEASFFGPEGKILSLSERTLARIKARHEARKQAQAQKPQQIKTAADTAANPHNAYYAYGGREGHMMALGNLPRESAPEKTKNDTVTDTIPAYIKDADTISRNQTVIIGDSKSVNKSVKERNNTFRHYVKLVGESLAQDAPYMK